jgi:radical SAM protein with 4Fe4S-binding SPASM domain
MPIDCRSPFKYAKINYNGDVILCQRFTVGNIKDRSFRDIWFGQTAEQLRNSVRASMRLCSSCDHYRFCIRGGEIDVGRNDNFIALSDRHKTFADPVKVGHYGTHSILRWNDDFFAVPKCDSGHVTILANAESHPDIIQTASIEKAREAIKRRMGASRVSWLDDLPENPTPPFIDPPIRYRMHNISEWYGHFVARPWIAPPVDLFRDSLANRPDIVVADSLESVKAAVRNRPVLPLALRILGQPRQAAEAGLRLLRNNRSILMRIDRLLGRKS